MVMATQTSWTYNQRRSLLSRALEITMANPDPTSTPVDLWIKDLSDTEVIYYANRRTFKRSYELSSDGEVKLGDSEEVIEQTIYKSVKVASFNLTEVVFSGASTVKMKGLVFRLGKYPDKNFSIDAKEWDSKSQSTFTPQNLDIEHATRPNGEFLTHILGHEFGALSSVSRKGNDIYGEVEVPKWLFELSGGSIGVSLAFGEDKKIVGCALTLSPRVAGAKVAAVFGEGDVIAGQEDDMNQNDPGFFAAVGAMFAGALASVGIGKPVETNAPDKPDIPAATVMSDPEKDELEKFRAAKAASNEAAAVKFGTDRAAALKAEGKILPAQEQLVAEQFTFALKQDNVDKAYFTDSGDPKPGARLSALEDSWKAAPKHGLFTASGDAEKAKVLSGATDVEDEDRKAKLEGLRAGFAD